jgi:hypothetical protein
MSKKEVENIEGGDEEIRSFWKPISLDELIEQQGITPIEDIKEVSSLWPADDDPEELYQFIISERRERRNLNHPKG